MDITVTMKICTHTCGTVYCVPNFIHLHECPVCAGKKVEEKDQHIKQIMRSNSGLRAALSRKNGRR